MAINRNKRTGSHSQRDAHGTSFAAAISSRAPDGSIKLTRTGGCVVATLARPSAHNRVSAAMARELIELAETVEDDSSILALAVTGAGSFFCTGFESDVDSKLVETLAILSKPTIAIINGDAIDEGFELALALDLRASTTSARFAMRQLERGQLPHFGGTQRLPRLAGPAQALRIILTGEALKGGEAMRLGLVTYLARDRTQLNRVMRNLLGAVGSRGPLAARMAKDAVLEGYDMTLGQGIRLEEDLYALLQTTSDRAEGVRAFLEKRKPLFKGA